MGKAVSAAVQNRSDFNIIAGIDTKGTDCAYPVFLSPFSFSGKADVLLDFSSPAALPGVLEYAQKSKTPVVIATTGLENTHIALLDKAASEVAVFYSANMSIGVNLLCELAKIASSVLGDTYDIEIVEAHHAKKADAPSGTALMIANAVSDGSRMRPIYKFGRHSSGEIRRKNEIGIHSIRGGTIAGEHEIIFAGDNEILKLGHIAQSIELFAVGALNAANFILDKPSGLYTMSDLISQSKFCK